MSSPVQSLTILGSTGSIGENTLDVIARNPERFRVKALTAHRNFERLAQQCAQFDAEVAVIGDPSLRAPLNSALKARGARAEVLCAENGLTTVAGMDEVDTVMAAIVGAAGLRSAMQAARTGKKILLANKESLVIAGEVFMRTAGASGARVLPVDSEHNAIFQALPEKLDQGLEAAGVEKLILTASGGPFLGLTQQQLQSVTPEQACNHPNWDMGRKISVDSATLMNKGLEVIEARWLFNAGPEQIDVLVHPQSIIHSMVAYRDGSVLAQLGTPDMRTPIAHALAWPERIEAGVKRLNLSEAADLSFQAPDLQRFPCLRLAFEAMRTGESAPALLNAANEVAVQSFLEGKIGFAHIANIVAGVMDKLAPTPIGSLEDIEEADRRSRAQALQMVNSGL
jgi:1-deoxy-D-xylulose-5-phosphate reductoisomerase